MNWLRVFLQPVFQGKNFKSKGNDYLKNNTDLAIDVINILDSSKNTI